MRKDTWYLSAEGAGTCAEGAGTCAEGARFVEYVLWAEGPWIVAFFFS